MLRFINDPNRYVDETVDGVLYAYPGHLRAVDHRRRVLVRADAPREDKVGVVTGGGSGHLPLFLGYVGRGLCDGVAIGNVFSSPSPEAVLSAAKAVDGGAGVLLLYGNYSGDVLNFGMAQELAEAEGLRTTSVRATDDVGSAPIEDASRRRGVGGLVFAYKVAGACAEEGASLEEVTAIAELTIRRTRTIGVALSSCVLPSETEPTFQLEEDQMEIGIGIHGEPGRERDGAKTADEVASLLLRETTAELNLRPGGSCAVLVNGLGGTSLEELFILYRHIHRSLDQQGIGIHRALVGNYATSLGTRGASLSVMELDDVLVRYLDAAATSPFFQD